MSRHSLRKIFPTQGLNPGLPHCRRILYHLSHQGSLPFSGRNGPKRKELWSSHIGCFVFGKTERMLENKRFWLVIIIYFRVVLFPNVWWMGFEKGNIQFTPLHKYNYYNHRWQSYLNIKSESEMWITGLEVARTGRWKHRCARSTGQRNGRSWTSYWALTSQPKWKKVTRQQAFIFRERERHAKCSGAEKLLWLGVLTKKRESTFCKGNGIYL